MQGHPRMASTALGALVRLRMVDENLPQAPLVADDTQVEIVAHVDNEL